MWTSVILFGLGLLPAQTGELEIVDARPTYGYLGAPRPRTGALPGDVLHFAYSIKGMKVDGKGRASYSLLMEVMNDKKEIVFKEGPRNEVAHNILGGDVVPCAAHLKIPLDIPPGEYTLRVTIEDRTTQKKAVFSATGKALPSDFGLIRVGTFADAATTVPRAPVGIVGETLHLAFSLTGFRVDKSTKKPDIQLSLKVIDDKGKPTLEEPLGGEYTDVLPEGLKTIPLRFGITLSRAGEFQVELTATDKLSNKTAKVTFPLKVLSP